MATHLLRKPVLNRRRILLAFAVAITADAVQLGLGPLGWAFFDEIIDVIALILLNVLVGFHPLFLPTFLVEFIPVIDMLPTWTGSLMAVITLKRKQNSGPPGPSPETSDVIDV